MTYTTHDPIPPLSATDAVSVNDVPAIAVVGEIAPTVGATASVDVAAAAATVTVTDVPSAIFPTVSPQLAYAVSVPLLAGV